ncbi:hypothetical protein AB1N83_001481 [Pleurotus pulmonarius]
MILLCLHPTTSEPTYVDDRCGGDYKEPIPPSLKACSLVCRAWLALSQSRIFRTVTMDYALSSFRRHIYRFDSLHLTAPHLCVHIRNLKLHFPVKGARVSRWLLGCITQFRNVRSLHLDGSAPCKSRLMDMLSSLGILDLLPTLQLQRLELPRWTIYKDASDLRRILLACPSTLQELSLEVTQQEKPRRAHSESGSSPTAHFSALRHLRLAQTSLRSHFSSARTWNPSQWRTKAPMLGVSPRVSPPVCLTSSWMPSQASPSPSSALSSVHLE